MDLQIDKSITDPEVNEAIAKIKAVYDEFLRENNRVKKEHYAAIDAVLKDIDERQINALKEKLKAL